VSTAPPYDPQITQKTMQSSSEGASLVAVTLLLTDLRIASLTILLKNIIK